MHRAATTLALIGLALLGGWLVSPDTPERSRVSPGLSEVAGPSEVAGTTEVAPAEPLPAEPPAWLSTSGPAMLRRLPARPSSCTNPPPGGAWQVATIEASRERRCEEALEAWSEGMAVSEDHCTLARTVWLCFNETHQAPLRQRSFRDFGELVPLLVHLEGEPARRALYNEDLASAGLPSWLWAAPSGLERRLQAFERDRELQGAVTDLFGEAGITDQLVGDLWLEFQIARALAALPPDELTPYVEEVWARRVYVLADALYGHTGELLLTHRRGEYDELRRTLDALAQDAAVPERVRRALAVARREESAL